MELIKPSWINYAKAIKEELKDGYDRFYEKPKIRNTLITGNIFTTIRKQADLLSIWAMKTGKHLEDIDDIIEFGGGFGTMAQVSSPLNRGYYFIIDLPELIELQQWYLAKMAKNEIYWIDIVGKSIFNRSCDMFIASYSLSEAGDYIIRKIIDSKFFNAESLLITFNEDDKDSFTFNKYIPELKQYGELFKLPNDGIIGSENSWMLVK